MKLLQELRNLSRRARRALAWDVFMVWVAILNLSLIAFDLTYLWLRPTYFHYLPAVTRIYDPVRDRPHSLTQTLLDEIETTRELVRRDQGRRAGAAPEDLRALDANVSREPVSGRQSALLGVLKQSSPTERRPRPSSRTRRSRAGGGRPLAQTPRSSGTGSISRIRSWGARSS
jgi:hypothetical protein